MNNVVFCITILSRSTKSEITSLQRKCTLPFAPSNDLTFEITGIDIRRPADSVVFNLNENHFLCEFSVEFDDEDQYRMRENEFKSSGWKDYHEAA